MKVGPAAARKKQTQININPTMKKRPSTHSNEAHGHPNLINYLALIHAVTHPGDRPDPGKRHRSHKSPAGAGATG